MNHIGIVDKGDGVVPIGGHHQGFSCVKCTHDPLKGDLCLKVFKGSRMAVWVCIETDDEVLQSEMRCEFCASIGTETTPMVNQSLVYFLYRKPLVVLPDAGVGFIDR
jgi:hypothetical protein